MYRRVLGLLEFLSILQFGKVCIVVGIKKINGI